MGADDHLVRVGFVSSIEDESRRLVRVAFPSYSSEVSGSLKVISTAPQVSLTNAGEHDHELGKYDGDHNHGATVKSWMPKVGQSVVCLFIQSGDGDGFVLGGL